MPEAPFAEGGLDLAALARAIGLPRNVAARLTRAGLMPGIGVGSDWFCSPEHFGAWMSAPPSDEEQRCLRQLLAAAGEDA